MTARWLIVAVMLIAELMDLLDATVVNVAGPSLERSLNSTATGLQWVIGGYALALGAGLILGGRLGDRYGRRPVFLLGLAAFTVSSLLCAVAPTIGFLIAARLMQGVAAAVLLPQGLGLLKDNFTGAELVKVFAVFGPVLGLGGVLGPIIGGGLIEADVFGLGWRAVFLVNVPIGLAALLAAWRVLPQVPGDRSVRIDGVGAAIVAGAAVLLVLPLNEGQAHGWPLWTWISFVVAIAAFGVFAIQQRRTAARGRVPLVVPTLFRKPAYTVGLVGIALFFCALIGSQLVLTLFLQTGHGYSAGQAGLGNLPLAVGTMIGGGLSGAFLAARIGRPVLQIGALVQLAGAALVWVGLDWGERFSIWHLIPGALLSGVGAGLVIAALFNFILAAVDDDEVGSASGVLSAVQSIGGSIGVAAVGSAFFAAVKTGTAADGYRDALLIQAGLLIAFLAITFLLPRTGRPDEFAAGSPSGALATPPSAP